MAEQSQSRSDDALMTALNESLRSGLLFGVMEEPLDAYGKRIVRVIVDAMERAAPRSERLTPGYTDAQRLDWLEKDVKDEPLLLHNLGLRENTHGFRGLGLSVTGRTLRQAIDQLMSAYGVKPPNGSAKR